MPTTKNYFILSRGAANRLLPGTTVFYNSGGTMLSAIFREYDQRSGMITLNDGSTMKRDHIYTHCASTTHLPIEYFTGHDDLFETMPSGMYELEEIMHNICAHCRPNKSCKKCPVRRTMDMLTGEYNFYEDALASNMGGYSTGEQPPERGKYCSKAPAISKELTEKLVQATCTYCPGRKLTDEELEETEMDDIYPGFGSIPGENCTKCPLYIHCKHNF